MVRIGAFLFSLAMKEISMLEKSTLICNTEINPHGIEKPRLNVIRLPKLTIKLDISKSSIYSWLDPKSPNYDPTFPTPILIGVKAVGWLESEVDDWLIERIKACRDASQGRE